MKVVILCGGNGIRLRNSLEFIPKAMIKIGYRPMLWHVMKIYAKYGFTDFVLALGSGGNLIKDYFINYDVNINDITIKLGQKDYILQSEHQERDWKITFVNTGDYAGTGARISRCQNYLTENDFLVTYSDCLADVNIKKLLDNHKKSNKIATITGVMPRFRYGEFIINDDEVVKWNEISNLKSRGGWVNGGFMAFNKKIFKYLEPFNECVLEKEVFTKLTNDKQINIYKHEGFWQELDNDREYTFLCNLCEKNSEFWLFDK